MEYLVKATNEVFLKMFGKKHNSEKEVLSHIDATQTLAVPYGNYRVCMWHLLANQKTGFIYTLGYISLLSFIMQQRHPRSFIP